VRGSARPVTPNGPGPAQAAEPSAARDAEAPAPAAVTPPPDPEPEQPEVEEEEEEEVPEGISAEDAEKDVFAYLCLKSVCRDKTVDTVSSLTNLGVSWLKDKGMASSTQQMAVLSTVVPRVLAGNPMEAKLRSKATIMWRDGLSKGRELASGILTCATLRGRVQFHLLSLLLMCALAYAVASSVWWYTTPTRTLWSILYEFWFDFCVYYVRYFVAFMQKLRQPMVFLGIWSPPGLWERLEEWQSIQMYEEMMWTRWLVWLAVAQLSALVSWIMTWNLRSRFLECNMAKK